MDFTNIKTFLKVSELHSFSQAAAKLGYAQPTVSMQIAKLEQELGAQLFERMGHRITLTEMGQRFLPYAQQLVILEEQMDRDLKGKNTAFETLRIALADSLCSVFFSGYLLRFRELFPHVSVVTHTGPTDLLFSMLNNNEVDMVYTLDNRISRSDLVVQQEQQENIHFCASADHPLVRALRDRPDGTLTWEQIREYPLYLTEAGVSYRYNLERMLGEYGYELAPAIELGNVQTLMQLVAQSEGISFLPEFVLEQEVRRGRLAVLPVEEIEIRVWRQLIYHKGKYLTPAMAGMMELLHSMNGGNEPVFGSVPECPANTL